jgi:hypothetical protein
LRTKGYGINVDFCGIIGRTAMVQSTYLLVLLSTGATTAGKDIQYYVRFEDFTAVAMKNRVFWDVTPCGSCKNRLFGGT